MTVPLADTSLFIAIEQGRALRAPPPPRYHLPCGTSCGSEDAGCPQQLVDCGDRNRARVPVATQHDDYDEVRGWTSSSCSVQLVTGYPPQPWELRGQLHFTAWRVPPAHLPRLSAGLEPVRAGGTALVGTAWVIYEPGGVLSYRELLVAVLAHRGGRPLVTITNIWVDSVPSLHGGRELWGIPKQWASFHVDGASCAAVDADGELIASAAVRPIGALPGRWRSRYTVAQQRAGELILSPVRCTSRMRLIRISWEFAPSGPLGWLTDARPAFSTSLRDFTLHFGRRPRFGSEWRSTRRQKCNSAPNGGAAGAL